MLFLKLGAILGLFFFISKILFKLLQINVENYPSRNQHCDFAKPVGNLMNNLVNNDTAKQGSNPCYSIVLYAWAMFHFRYETNAQLYPMNFFIWSFMSGRGLEPRMYINWTYKLTTGSILFFSWKQSEIRRPSWSKLAGWVATYFFLFIYIWHDRIRDMTPTPTCLRARSINIQKSIFYINDIFQKCLVMTHTHTHMEGKRLQAMRIVAFCRLEHLKAVIQLAQWLSSNSKVGILNL